MVVRGGKYAQVVRSRNGGAILRNRVADSRRVSGNGCFLNIITGLGADQKAFVAEHSVNVGRRTFEHIEEGTRVKVWLLEMEIKLGAEVLRLWLELGQDFSFQAFGDMVRQLKLRVKQIRGRPRLGEGQSCRTVNHQQCCMATFNVYLTINVTGLNVLGVSDEAQIIERCTSCSIRIFALNL